MIRVTATKKETSYTTLESVTSTPTTFTHIPSALLAAKKEIVVDLMLLNGETVEGVRLSKGIIYPIEFLQVMKSSLSFNRGELWVLFLPGCVRPGMYT